MRFARSISAHKGYRKESAGSANRFLTQESAFYRGKLCR